MSLIFEKVEKYRFLRGPFASQFGDDYGAFLVPGPCGRTLKVIASSGSDEIRWEHVSVSTHKSAPNWIEMCFIKDLFWDVEVTVMQLHPPKSEWINNHPYCLHLWKPLDQAIPTPPPVTVGYKELNLA